MNPLDLRGPEFLLFYLVLAVGVLAVQRWVLLAGEDRGAAGAGEPEDPYAIAYLRGGGHEALRVAVVSLVDRGLLRDAGEMIVATPDASAHARRPTEQEIVAYFREPAGVERMFATLAPDGTLPRYETELSARGLLPAEEDRARRGIATTAAVLLLSGVAVAKIAVALSRGRHNVLFLIVLAGVAVVVAFALSRRRRTTTGDEVLRVLRARFDGLRRRAAQLRPGGATNEPAYLAAVFGLAALPSAYFPWTRTLFPKAATSSGGDGFVGGCGSSGCGGGGGGGGCGGGGCGGCGS